MTLRRWLIVMTVFLTLTLAACGGKDDKSTQTEATAAPAAQSTAPKAAAGAKPTAAPAAQPTAEPTDAPVATPEEELLSLASRDTGLDQLTSYRATWRADWKSTEAGKTETSSWEWTEEYTADPQARHFNMKTPDSNDPTKLNAFEMWQIGDITYMKGDSDDECIAFSSEDSAKNMDQRIFRPDALGRIEDGKYVGRETVNGIPTKHYTYSSKLSAVGGTGEVAGETWVAIDGGYVVKDTVIWQGGSGFLGLGGSEAGEGTWTWEIAEVNTVKEITTPEGCELPDVLDLPIMPDATEKAQFGSMISYKSASPMKDVVAFYQEELVASGWTPEGEPTEMDEIAMLNFAKDGKTLNLMITSSDGATQVVLSTEK